MEINLVLSILLYVLVLLVLLFVSYTAYVLYVRWKYRYLPSPPITGFLSGHADLMKAAQESGRVSWGDITLEWCLKLKTDVLVLFTYHCPIVMTVGPDCAKVILTSKCQKPFFMSDLFGFPVGERLAGNGLLTELFYDAWKPKRARLTPAFHRTCRARYYDRYRLYVDRTFYCTISPSEGSGFVLDAPIMSCHSRIHKPYLKSLVPAMNYSVSLLLKKLHGFADGKTQISLHAEISRTALNIIANAACGMEVDLINEESEFARHISNIFINAEQEFTSWIFPLLPWNWSFINQCKTSVRKLRKTAEGVIRKRLEDAAAGMEGKKDLIYYLLQIKDGEQPMTMEDMKDEFVTFFVAGHETTASAVSFLFMEYGYHPDVEENVLEEIHSVLGSKEEVEEEDIPKLRFIGETFKEILRLYPIAQQTERYFPHEVVLGSHKVPAGSDIAVSFYANGRHPEYWTRPRDFYPERFENEDAHYNPMMFTPFSGGPRNCIGQYFAQMEAKILVARLLREFEIKVLPGQHGKLYCATSVRPRDGTLVTLLPRKKEM